MTPEELDRLVKMTPEAVVEAATDAAREAWDWGESLADTLRAALPLLLAPEVAKREAAERERDGFRHRMGVAEERVSRLGEPWTDEHGTAWLAPTAHAYAMTCRALHAASAERDRLKAALESLSEIEAPHLPVHGGGPDHCPACVLANVRSRFRAALSGRDTV